MPKLIDHAARRAQYAEATWRVILSQGIEAMSVRNVATEAGVSVGSLRHLFPTQDALAGFAMSLVAERVEARIRAVPARTDPVEYVTSLLLEVLPLDTTRRAEAQVWLAFTAAAATRPALAEVHREQFEALAELCRRVVRHLAAADRIPADRDLGAEARRLHALLDGLTLHVLTAGADDAQQGLERHLTSVVS